MTLRSQDGAARCCTSPANGALVQRDLFAHRYQQHKQERAQDGHAECKGERDCLPSGATPGREVAEARGRRTSMPRRRRAPAGQAQDRTARSARHRRAGRPTLTRKRAAKGGKRPATTLRTRLSTPQIVVTARTPAPIHTPLAIAPTPMSSPVRARTQTAPISTTATNVARSSARHVARQAQSGNRGDGDSGGVVSDEHCRKGGEEETLDQARRCRAEPDHAWSECLLKTGEETARNEKSPTLDVDWRERARSAPPRPARTSRRNSRARTEPSRPRKMPRCRAARAPPRRRFVPARTTGVPSKKGPPARGGSRDSMPWSWLNGTRRSHRQWDSP